MKRWIVSSPKIPANSSLEPVGDAADQRLHLERGCGERVGDAHGRVLLGGWVERVGGTNGRAGRGSRPARRSGRAPRRRLSGSPIERRVGDGPMKEAGPIRAAYRAPRGRRRRRSRRGRAARRPRRGTSCGRLGGRGRRGRRPRSASGRTSGPAGSRRSTPGPRVERSRPPPRAATEPSSRCRRTGRDAPRASRSVQRGPRGPQASGGRTDDDRHPRTPRARPVRRRPGRRDGARAGWNRSRAMVPSSDGDRSERASSSTIWRRCGSARAAWTSARRVQR